MKRKRLSPFDIISMFVGKVVFSTLFFLSAFYMMGVIYKAIEPFLNLCFDWWFNHLDICIVVSFVACLLGLGFLIFLDKRMEAKAEGVSMREVDSDIDEG